MHTMSEWIDGWIDECPGSQHPMTQDDHFNKMQNAVQTFDPINSTTWAFQLQYDA
jgi:hypothetical protein